MPSATQNRRWIKSSVHDWLVTTFPALTFNFGKKRSDLDALLAGASPVVLVDWLKRSGTQFADVRQVAWPLQLTVLAKITPDPYGVTVDDVVSEIAPGFRVARIPILDYTDVENPVATPYSLIALDVDDDDLSDGDTTQAVAITIEFQYFERP